MEKKKIFVLPGEIAVTRQPALIGTLLGSCVAVCLYNRKLKFGGMNHYLLPSGTDRTSVGKFGDKAMDKLIGAMLKIDPEPRNLEAKIYGGGKVVSHLASSFDVGEKNVAIAVAKLKENNISIVKREVRGEQGRKILFNNYTGEVELRMVEKSEVTLQAEAKSKDLAGRKIRTLIVDDSSTVRTILRKALQQDDQIEVVGEAEDAFEARKLILELDPDVITLDIIMPKLDGVSFLKKLMVHYPKPVIIVSSVAQKGSRMRMRAQEIGAVDVVDKEDLKLYQGLDTVTRILTQKVKMASTAHVGRKEVGDVASI